MIIAFEGPDKVGKSTVARELSTAGTPIYNMTVHDYHDVVGSLQESQIRSIALTGLIGSLIWSTG